MIQVLKKKPLWPSPQPSLPGRSASPLSLQQNLPPVLLVAEPSKRMRFHPQAIANHYKSAGHDHHHYIVNIPLYLRVHQTTVHNGQVGSLTLLQFEVLTVKQLRCTWAASMIFFRISSCAVRCALIISQLSFLCFDINSVHSFVCSATIPINLVSASACTISSLVLKAENNFRNLLWNIYGPLVGMDDVDCLKYCLHKIQMTIS